MGFGGRYVPVGRCPAADRGGSREAGVEQSSTALTGAAGGKVQGNARTALVPGGHRSALTEPAGETAQRIGRGPGAEAPQEGDIRPPFFGVWEGRTYGPAPP